MVFFTDGYANYPDHRPEYPVLWIVTKDHQKPPFGKVAFILED
jgi:predicted metal-dependent peptidase